MPNLVEPWVARQFGLAGNGRPLFFRVFLFSSSFIVSSSYFNRITSNSIEILLCLVINVWFSLITL